MLLSNGFPYSKIWLKKFDFSPIDTPANIAQKLPSQCWPKPLFIPLFNFSHKRPTFTFTGESGYTTRLLKKDRTQGHTRRNRGLPDGAAITTLDTYCTFTNIPGPGVRAANFAAFGSWPGVRRTQKACGTAMRIMRVAVPRRRGPAGLRSSSVHLQNRQDLLQSLLYYGTIILPVNG